MEERGHAVGVPCKLFVGGISSQTNTEALHLHFSKYGQLIDAVVMSKNGRARGFGFVTFDSTGPAVQVLAEPQWLDGRLVDVKRAVPGERTQERSSNKVFVGGLAQDVTTDMLKDYFGAYGSVADAVVMVDRRTNRSRGFGFVRFANGAQGSAAAQAVLLNFSNHRLQGKWVEVKSATPAAVLQELSPCSADGSSNGSNPLNFMDQQMMSMYLDASACGWDPSAFGMTSPASPANAPARGHARGRRGRRRKQRSGGELSDEDEDCGPDDDDLLSCFTGSSVGSPTGLVAPPGLGGAGTPPFVPQSLQNKGSSPLSAIVAMQISGAPTPLSGGRGPCRSVNTVGRSKPNAGSNWASENDPGRANSANGVPSSPMKVTCRDTTFETFTKQDRFDGFTRDDFLALEVRQPPALSGLSTVSAW
eukprot:CAMPEP_0115068594 /NCGR_PEP_ID=MMETSP0227-20121206/12061_1 /TAXON_ID=89957 /ORGANISM="Polarella glacialis, Strain CCMP 1383" /LENGTH=418 /DNA_ID=CAMNT_0002454847 /DNA_START=59 /DNA_END=1315 /DNA_ORIENTATION=-